MNPGQQPDPRPPQYQQPYPISPPPLQYGGPMQPYMYTAPLQRPTSGLATASMVLGILGLLVGWCSFGIPSIIAVLLGHNALRETKTGQRGGHGQAITGLILGYIVAIPAAIVTIIIIVGAAGGS